MKKRHSSPNIERGGKTPASAKGRCGKAPKTDMATAAPRHVSPPKNCKMR